MAKLNDYMRSTTFPAGTNIITVEQPGEVTYVVLEGTLKIHVEQADGSDVILAILGAGEVVGEMSMVDHLGRSANVVTMEPSRLCWLDRATFWECMATMPTMNYNLVFLMSRRLRLANAQIQSLATLDVFGRVARQLLAFAHEYGSATGQGDVVIPMHLTQSDLAAMIGATRVRVNQVLVDFKERKYISVDQNYRITVHNQDALAQRCT